MYICRMINGENKIIITTIAIAIIIKDSCFSFDLALFSFLTVGVVRLGMQIDAP